MRQTVLGLCLVAGLGLTGYLLASEGGGDQPGCSSASLASKQGCGGCGGHSSGDATVAQNANYVRAEELLKSWKEAPVKLASMSETEKTDLMTSAAKLRESLPAAAAFEPTMAFLHDGMVTLTQIDAAGKQLCAQAAAPTTRPAAAEGSTGASTALASADAPTCPKTAAALASAHQKMQQSVALTAKANELLLVAYQTAAASSLDGKGECCKSKAAGATAKLASAEGKPAGAEGGCCASKDEAKLTAAADKAAKSGSCGQKGEAALASATEKSAKTEGGCCGDKSAAKLTAATEKSAKSGCCGEKGEATLASAADKDAKCEGGSCGSAKTTAALASGEQKLCPKALAKQSQELVARSGQLLAQWEGANIRLASMDSTERGSVVKLASDVMAACPIGSRMPETMETVAGLLRDAATLNAQAMAACCHNPGVAKAIPEASKDLAKARFQVISAMLNVLEKSNGAMKPAREVASAQ